MKTTVKRDRHGLYVKGCGYYWRPDWPNGVRHARKETVLQEGQTVSLHHGGGHSAIVRPFRGGRETREYWHCHGMYVGKSKGKTSEDFYRPEYETW